MQDEREVEEDLNAAFQKARTGIAAMTPDIDAPAEPMDGSFDINLALPGFCDILE